MPRFTDIRASKRSSNECRARLRFGQAIFAEFLRTFPSPLILTSNAIASTRHGLAAGGLPGMTSASDVFISYKAEDRQRLVPLVAALEAEGFSVWWDARIGGGANWRQEIERHLDAASCVIVAWSKRSVGPEGHFVRDEASRALKLGTYLPVLLDAVDPPLGFG